MFWSSIFALKSALWGGTAWLSAGCRWTRLSILHPWWIGGRLTTFGRTTPGTTNENGFEWICMFRFGADRCSIFHLYIIIFSLYMVHVGTCVYICINTYVECMYAVYVYMYFYTVVPKKVKKQAITSQRQWHIPFLILFRDFLYIATSLLCHGWYRISSHNPRPISGGAWSSRTPISESFIFGTWGCSEEAAADRGIWDWLKEIEFFREKPWVQKSSVCLGACDACDFSCIGLKGNIRGPCVLCIRSWIDWFLAHIAWNRVWEFHGFTRKKICAQNLRTMGRTETCSCWMW